MFDYEAIMIKNKQIKHNAAISCLLWIERAFACGVIREGQGLIKKLDEANQEKKVLEQELATLADGYKELEKEFKEFKKRVNLQSDDEWTEKEK
jgi:predicted nuclease with TOPRIM domain